MKKLFLLSVMSLHLFSAKAQIETKYDEFSRETSHRTPYSGWTFGVRMPEALSGYTFIDSSLSTRHYLNIRCFTSNLGGIHSKGAHILFTDGSKLFYDEDVEYEYNSTFSTYIATCFVDVSKEDLEAIATKRVKAVRLYVSDRYLQPKEQERILSNFNLLISK